MPGLRVQRIQYSAGPVACGADICAAGKSANAYTHLQCIFSWLTQEWHLPGLLPVVNSDDRNCYDQPRRRLSTRAEIHLLNPTIDEFHVCFPHNIGLAHLIKRRIVNPNAFNLSTLKSNHI